MNPIRHDLADADHVGLVGWGDTYWDGPAWRNRRNDCTEPFSSARRDTRQIIAGARSPSGTASITRSATATAASPRSTVATPSYATSQRDRSERGGGVPVFEHPQRAAWRASGAAFCTRTTRRDSSSSFNPRAAPSTRRWPSPRSSTGRRCGPARLRSRTGPPTGPNPRRRSRLLPIADRVFGHAGEHLIERGPLARALPLSRGLELVLHQHDDRINAFQPLRDRDAAPRTVLRATSPASLAWCRSCASRSRRSDSARSANRRRAVSRLTQRRPRSSSMTSPSSWRASASMTSRGP
jgi:hypothetical protein